MTKTAKIRQILRKRILHGDYLLSELPAERELAEEVGVSRMTARKAVQQLVDEGWLRRQANGRLAVASRAAGLARVGFLVPSLVSPDVEAWRLAMEPVAAEFDAGVRAVMYLHWDDPVILQALRAFDAVFLYPSCEAPPAALLARLREERRRVVVVEQDWSAEGLLSLCLFPVVFMQRLLDELLPWAGDGVDCFNVQTRDRVMEARVRQWGLWRSAHRLPGDLMGEPIRPYGNPLEEAHAQMSAILAGGGFRRRALVCTTAPAAIGAVRALHDHGLRVGRDVGVCVVNDERLARYVTPSLTSLCAPDPTPYLRLCLEWVRDPSREWQGSLLLEPDAPSLFRGESTGHGRGSADP